MERVLASGGDRTVRVVFDEPAADDPLLLIVDDSAYPGSPADQKAMYYAFRLYVNGEEQRLYRYIRNATYPLPLHIAAKKGEEITVSVLPVDASNYEAFFDDGSGIPKTSATFTMDRDVTLRIKVNEKDNVYKIPVAGVTSNSYYAGNATWNPDLLKDGKRLSEMQAGGYSSKGFPTPIPDEPVTVTLDLGSVWKFNQISLVPRSCFESLTGGTRGFPSDYTISISQDGKNYQTVVTVKDHPDPFYLQQIYRVGDVEAQYVRLTVTKFGAPDYAVNAPVRYRVQLAEIEVVYLAPDPAAQNPQEESRTAEDTAKPESPSSEGSGSPPAGEAKHGCSSSASVTRLPILFPALAALLLCKKRKRKPSAAQS